MTKVTRLLLSVRRIMRVVLPIIFILATAPAYVHAYQLTQNGVSEVPTLFPRDVIIVNHTAYDFRLPYSTVQLFRTGSPKRDEMVLVRLPNGQGVAPKRVVALPGDTVELKDNRLIVNGQPASTTQLNRSDFRWVPGDAKMGSTIEDENGHYIAYTPGKGDHRNFGPLVLANDRYFVLGDNRDESMDSRDWGTLPETSILGKVILTVPVGRRR